MRPADQLDRVPAQVLVLGSITSLQFGAAFARQLFDQVGPAGTVFIRLTFSAVLLLVIVRPRLRGRTRPEWVAAVSFGVVLALLNWTFYEALARLPLGVAVAIEFLGPLGVAVAGSRRWLDGLWVLLAAGGVALLELGGGPTGRLDRVGVGLALLAGALWATYILLSQRVGARLAGLDGLALAMPVGALFIAPAGLISGGTGLLHPSVLLVGLLIATLSSAIPFSLELIALRRLPTATFGLLMSLEPAVAALAGVLILSQPVYLHVAAALVMIIVASAGSTLALSRRQRTNATASPEEQALSP